MDQTSTSDSRPRLSRKRKVLSALVLLVVVVASIEVVSRVLFAPWSIGVLGRDTLTGEWVGELRANQGSEYGLYLKLDYKDRPTGSSSSGTSSTTNLKGRATLCTPTGERFDYEVSGRASRSGNVERLWVEYGDPTLSALNLRLSGECEAPELRLEADANPFLPDGSFMPQRPISSDDPDDSFAPFTLTKDDADALEEICQRIGP